jgi:hypothetical protein
MSERDLEDLQEHSERLGERIEETREEWERKQRDDSVPGAVGEPASENELPPPEPDETD